MSCQIGYGIRSIRARASGPFWAALAAVVGAFVADTWSTAAAGADGRLTDLNPLVRTLSPATYVAFGICRGIVAVLLLVWFWPGELRRRGSWSAPAALFVPFAYHDARQYFGAVLVMVAAAVKIAAACRNIEVLGGGPPGLDPWQALAVGLVAGLALSNLLLYLQHRRSGGRH